MSLSHISYSFFFSSSNTFVRVIELLRIKLSIFHIMLNIFLEFLKNCIKLHLRNIFSRKVKILATNFNRSSLFLELMSKIIVRVKIVIFNFEIEHFEEIKFIRKMKIHANFHPRHEKYELKKFSR